MRLRFTIRDLLWLTALAAVSVGWWIDAAVFRQQRQMFIGQSEAVREKSRWLDIERDDVAKRAADLDKALRDELKSPANSR